MTWAPDWKLWAPEWKRWARDWISDGPMEAQNSAIIEAVSNLGQRVAHLEARR
jgi:hypothetical protein